MNPVVSLNQPHYVEKKLKGIETPPFPGLNPAPIKGSKAAQLAGCTLVFIAAVCFYLSTATVRWAKGQVDISPAFFVFTRLLLGFLIVCLSLAVKRKGLRPRRYGLLIGRAVANTASVYCFYAAVSLTSLAQANILNMTNPIFVAVFSWFLLKHQRDKVMTMGPLVAFFGIYLILARGPLSIGWLHMWGLASGIFAACAVLFLNVSRRHHDTETILFFLFGLGAIIIYTVFHESIHWPGRQEAYYLVLCSGFAIMGQYCVTYGHRFVTAVEGGIISSTRIPIAAVLGPAIAGDAILSIQGWIGTAIIFSVNILLASRKTKSNNQYKTGEPTLNANLGEKL